MLYVYNFYFFQAKKRKEGAPQHPGAAFVIFCRKWRPKLNKKHPGISVKEANAKLTERYASLSAEKKKVYVDEAATALVQYKKEMKEFEREHPDLVAETTEPPKKPPTAMDLYVQKHAQVPRADAVSAFKALSREEKERYVAKARRLRERYISEVEAYKEQYPGWKMPAAALRPMKGMGIKKPPRTPYNAFVREIYHTVDQTLPNGERLSLCNKMWRSLDAETKARYQRKAAEERAQYLEHIKTLPEEQQAELRAKVAVSETKDRSEAKKSLRKIRSSVKRITAQDLFLKEKMPTDSGVLSNEEWRRVLLRKFSKLSVEDKVVIDSRRVGPLDRQTEVTFVHWMDQHSHLKGRRGGVGCTDLFFFCK